MRLIVDTDKSLERETFSKAILSKDATGYERYLAKRKAMESKQQDIDNLKDDINSLKSDMNTLKEMLGSLLEKIR